MEGTERALIDTGNLEEVFVSRGLSVCLWGNVGKNPRIKVHLYHMLMTLPMLPIYLPI